MKKLYARIVLAIIGPAVRLALAKEKRQGAALWKLRNGADPHTIRTEISINRPTYSGRTVESVSTSEPLAPRRC